MKQPKVILITGSSRGIGESLVRHYLELGEKVIGFSRGSSSVQHESYVHFSVDVSNELQVKDAFKQIRNQFGYIDVVINNAGINPSISPFVLLPSNIIQNTYAVNVFGTMNVCREAVKLMIKRRFGRIINLSSMAVKHEVEGESIYTSSKAAINAFSRVLAKEIFKSGITCNVLSPAAIPTELSAKVNGEALKEILSRNAIKDMGCFEDVSNSIDWIIKEESGAITGQIIYLGGV